MLLLIFTLAFLFWFWRSNRALCMSDKELHPKLANYFKVTILKNYFFILYLKPWLICSLKRLHFCLMYVSVQQMALPAFIFTFGVQLFKSIFLKTSNVLEKISKNQQGCNLLEKCVFRGDCKRTRGIYKMQFLLL